MKTTNSAIEKAKKFAVRILNLATYIKTEKGREEIVSLLVEAGLKIGSTLSYAFDNEFNDYVFETFQKTFEYTLATNFYLEVLFANGMLTEKEYKSISADCKELISITKELLKSIHEGV